MLQRSMKLRRSGRGFEVQKTQHLAIQDDSHLGEGVADIDTGMRVQPEMFKFLEVMGIEEERIPTIIEEARKWWREVGSYRSGKLVMRVEDFDKEHAESVMLFLLSKDVKVK